MDIHHVRQCHVHYGIHNFGKDCAKGDSDILEKVRRAATRTTPELKGLPCKERLEKLDLVTMSYCRPRGDLILMYRILINDFGPEETLTEVY